MSKTKRLAFLGLTVAAAIILSYVEMLLPPISTIVPGIKMGLANIVVIFTMYKLSFKDAVIVSLVRIIVVVLLFGSVLTMLYSVVGATLSLLVMFFIKKVGLFSTVGVSVSGAIAHNLGQIIVAAFLMKTIQIGYYFAILAISGIISGAIIGLLGALLLKYSEKIKL